MGIYEINHKSMDREEDAIYQRIFGGFNSFPPDWHEVSEEDFVQYYRPGGFSVKWQEYKQMHHEDGSTKKGSWRDPYTEAVLQFFSDGSGFAVVPEYREKKVRFYRFNALKSLKKFFEDMPVKEDSGWSMNKHTSRPIRGISNYERTIRFTRNPTQTEMKYILMYLRADNCPGWTGVGSKLIGVRTNTWKFTTTYDCSG